MLSFTLIMAMSLTATVTGAAAIARKNAEQVFHIPYTHAYSPSGRPGSETYCSLNFTLTDVATDTTTQCYAQHGPCAWSTPEPPPEKPLDKDHPAPCADSSFSFYLTYWEYVSNYSIVVSHAVDGGEHTGPSGFLDYETYRDSFSERCAASGFCDAYIENETNPIVIAFV